MTFFTYWEPNSCILLCIDTPQSLQSNLKTTLSKKTVSVDSEDPFGMHVPLMDEIVKLYDRSVWEIRDLVRPIEKVYSPSTSFFIPNCAKLTLLNQTREKQKGKKDKETDFSLLHEISRHSLHVKEVIAVTSETVEDLRKQRQAILQVALEKQKKSPPAWEKVNSYLKFQTQILRNYQLRQQSNHERLQAEITLVR